ncbi:hypothetical protein HDU93_006149 [Gonapodya sp. JEL0774]|nr:hypothetical protein HDU93_006149 [Gonapodya sp. JEL0774]
MIQIRAFLLSAEEVGESDAELVTCPREGCGHKVVLKFADLGWEKEPYEQDIRLVMQTCNRSKHRKKCNARFDVPRWWEGRPTIDYSTLHQKLRRNNMIVPTQIRSNRRFADRRAGGGDDRESDDDQPDNDPPDNNPELDSDENSFSSSNSYPENPRRSSRVPRASKRSSSSVSFSAVGNLTLNVDQTGGDMVPNTLTSTMPPGEMSISAPTNMSATGDHLFDPAAMVFGSIPLQSFLHPDPRYQTLPNNLPLERSMLLALRTDLSSPPLQSVLSSVFSHVLPTVTNGWYPNMHPYTDPTRSTSNDAPPVLSLSPTSTAFFIPALPSEISAAPPPAFGPPPAAIRTSYHPLNPFTYSTKTAGMATERNAAGLAEGLDSDGDLLPFWGAGTALDVDMARLDGDEAGDMGSGMEAGIQDTDLENGGLVASEGTRW